LALAANVAKALQAAGRKRVEVCEPIAMIGGDGNRHDVLLCAGFTQRLRAQLGGPPALPESAGVEPPQSVKRDHRVRIGFLASHAGTLPQGRATTRVARAIGSVSRPTNK